MGSSIVGGRRSPECQRPQALGGSRPRAAKGAPGDETARCIHCCDTLPLSQLYEGGRGYECDPCVSPDAPVLQRGYLERRLRFGLVADPRRCPGRAVRGRDDDPFARAGLYEVTDGHGLKATRYADGAALTMISAVGTSAHARAVARRLSTSCCTRSPMWLIHSTTGNPPASSWGLGATALSQRACDLYRCGPRAE